MSHHLDSPSSRQDPRLNLTDLYAFDGETGTVLAMVTNSSLAGDSHPRGFHPEGRYEFKIHLDGSAVEQLTYRFTFGTSDASGSEDLRVAVLTGSDASDDEATGTEIATGRTGVGIDGPGGLRVWTGTAADPFYLDLGQLVHIIEGLQHQTPIDFGDWSDSAAASSFTGSRVDVIVLEIPQQSRELALGSKVGVWAATKLATDAGGWRQINRAAIPMIWPLLRAIGGDDESAVYERDTLAQPADDPANDTDRFVQIISAVVEGTGIGSPTAYARAVAARLLPDLLPYEVGTPAAFSFAGFNGRALADNAPEVMYGLLTNSAIATGLKAASAADTRQKTFPYVVPSA